MSLESKSMSCRRLVAFEFAAIDLDAQAVRLRHGDHAVGDLEGVGQHRIAKLAGGDFVAGGEGGQWRRPGAAWRRWRCPAKAGRPAAEPRRRPRPRRRTPWPARFRRLAPGRSRRRAPRRSARRSARRPAPRIARQAASGTLVCRPSDGHGVQLGRIERIEKELQVLELQAGAEVAGGLHVEPP